MADMENDFPTIEQVRAALAPLTLRQLDKLGELSGVPATTIYKIKRGETENPGINTVRSFVAHIAEAKAAA
jgi:predicted transcriptional regulator